MIEDEFVISLLFMVMLLVINVIGYTRLPLMSIVGLLGTLAVSIDTINDFGDYYMFGFILVLINIVLPAASLIRLR